MIGGVSWSMEGLKNVGKKEAVRGNVGMRKLAHRKAHAAD
jgi:hypothetical protein